MESIAGVFFLFSFSSFDTIQKQIATQKLSQITPAKGWSNLTVNKVRKFEHLPDLDGIRYTFFFNPRVHTKRKKKRCDRQQYQFLGHLHFGQRTNKVVHFRKLEDEETTKNKKKSLTPQLGRKSSHTGSWVSVVMCETLMSFLGRRPRPVP